MFVEAHAKGWHLGEVVDVCYVRFKPNRQKAHLALLSRLHIITEILKISALQNCQQT